MIKKILKSGLSRKKPVDFETYEYWEATTEESVVVESLKYWQKMSDLRNKTYSAREIIGIQDKDILNSIFAEEIMGWVWTDKPIAYIVDFIPTGFMINEKVKTNITHYSHKCVPIQLPDFTSEEYTLKVIDRLKVSGVQFGLQPTEDGYEIYSEKHRLSIFGRTLGEVVCKLALITLVNVHTY